MKNLKEKLVLITGGAGGLGFSSARAFAAEGAHVILADIQEEAVVRAARELSDQFGVETAAYRIDVTSTDSIRLVFSSVRERFGRLDVLVNSAGINIRRATTEYLEKDWDKLIDVNLKGTFFCCQQAALLMGDRGGAIVNFSSGSSARPLPGRAPYVASKGGINALTAALAAEWGKDTGGSKAIRVNAVAPGWIATEMLQEGFRSGVVSQEQILAAVPFKRLAEPEEIASVVVFLASDEASYITGHTLFIDGGQNALGLPDLG